MSRRPVGVLLEDILERVRRIARHPEVPWRRVIGLRNRVVHEYFDVDLELVWQIVHNELPELESQLRSVLAGLAADEREA